MHSTTAPIKKTVFSQPKVLVLEGDRDNLIYLVNTLKLLDCDCPTASEAMLALSLAQQEQPDLILLDLQMPQINGIELFKTLRIDWLTRDIPVVAITSAIAGETKAILDAGFDGYLLKPHTLRDLEKAIANHLPNAICNW